MAATRFGKRGPESPVAENGDADPLAQSARAFAATRPLVERTIEEARRVAEEQGLDPLRALEAVHAQLVAVTRAASNTRLEQL